MTKTWRKFKKDRYFFLKYFFMQMLTSLALLSLLYYLRTPFAAPFHLSLPLLALVPFSVMLGVAAPALLHNAVHGNLPRPWMNEVLGEVIGFFVLFGLGPFRISHFLHHAFADTDRDPHPPLGKGFGYFLATTQMNTIKVIRRSFLDHHGDTRAMHGVLFAEMAFYYVSLVARVACWVWLLGPALFVVAYLPAYVTNVLVFAHINFATHKTHADGTTEIVNARYRQPGRAGARRANPGGQRPRHQPRRPLRQAAQRGESRPLLQGRAQLDRRLSGFRSDVFDGGLGL